MRFLKLFLLVVLTVPFMHGGTFWGGTEDWGYYYGGPSNPEGQGDFNDMVFNLTSPTLTLNSSSSWSSVASGGYNGSGQGGFWDNQSLDGSGYNIGYCLFGGGNCNLPGGVLSNGQMLEGLSGAQASDVSFSASGSVTATLNMRNSALNQFDEIGWINPNDPTQNGIIFAGTATDGTQINFTPSSTFLIWTNFTGYQGPTPNPQSTFYSQSSFSGDGDPNFSHFSWFQGSQLGGIMPEPGTLPTVISGALLIGASIRLRRKKK